METLVPTYWFTDRDDKDIRDHFQKKKKPYTEDTMIEILKNMDNKNEMWWAILALRKIGTKKSIKYLKDIVHYKYMDVQATSVLTIAKLAEGTENEFFGKLLLDKEFKQKTYAMTAIFYEANDKPLKYIIEYGIDKIKNCKNMPDVGGLVLTYLARYAPENEDCKKIFTKVNKDFENLYPFGKKCLREEFPEIFGK